MSEDIRPLDNLRCLVTGGGGYLGQNLVKALLAKGCEVRVLDTIDEPTRQPGVTWIKGDIRNEADVREALEGVEVVFHTAALIELAERAPKKFKELVRGINIGGTKQLCAIAQEMGVKRLVHTSSTNAVYLQETVGGDETGPYSTSKDLYSSTKAESEQAALAADKEGGLRTAAIRPGGIYGPGERKTLIGPMVKSIRAGLPIITFGNGRTRLDYTYIDSLVDGHLRAAERLYDGSVVCGQAYFITDDSPINPGEFSVRLVRYMGLGTKPIRIPRPVALGMARMSERAFERFGKPRPEVTEVSVNLCTVDNFFSIEKARKELGYEPLVDVEEGLRRTAEDAVKYYHRLIH